MMESIKLQYKKKFVFDKKIFIYNILSILIAIGFFLYFLYLLRAVHIKTEKILLLFLDIPRKNLHWIYKKCDSFLKFCNTFSLEKSAQKKLILHSSDEEDEFDKFIQKKVNRIKKKNNSRKNYFYYLVSRKSIIQKFRQSKNKEVKTISFIILVTLLTLFFGVISMIDVGKILNRVITYVHFEFNFNNSLAYYSTCLTFQK